MPTLIIQGTELHYESKDILSFPEGLLGMPELKRMVIVRQTAIEPFMWLASLDQEGVAFVIAEAQSLFPDYAPELPADSDLHNVLAPGEKPVLMAIILVAAEWQKTSANLRAPLFVAAQAMQAAQLILQDHRYEVAAQLPFAA